MIRSKGEAGTGNIVEAKTAYTKGRVVEVEGSEEVVKKDSLVALPKTAPPKEVRGFRLPDDWVLTKALGQWAIDNFDVTPAKVRDQAAAFKDFWTSKPGAAGRKLDWPATWRNWCRNAKGWRRREGVSDEVTDLLLDSADYHADYHAEWDKARAMMGGDPDDA